MAVTITITAPLPGARPPRRTTVTTRYERAYEMATALAAQYTTALAACTTVAQVSALLTGSTLGNPRLRVTTDSDRTVRVLLRNEPKDIPLLTIHAGG